MMLITAYTLLTVSGLLWGLREYSHKMPDVFEKAFKVRPVSFFGSLSWLLKYKGNDPKEGYKNPVIAVFPYNDFWHSSHYVSKAGIVFGTLLLNRSELFGFSFGNVFVTAALVFVITTFWAGLAFRVLGRLVKNKNRT